MRSLFLFLILIQSAPLAGCGTSAPAGQATSAAVAETIERAAAYSPKASSRKLSGSAAARTDSCGAPLRVVIIQDKSRSSSKNRTPQIGVADLEPLIARVSVCSGEIGVGLIAAASNLSLTRLYIPDGPEPPAKPERRGTPFDVAKRRARYERDSSAFQAVLADHEATVSARVAAFRVEVEKLLDRPNDASRSDILGAVARSAYFLDERSHWRRSPLLVAAIISDAIDNVGASRVQLPQGAQLHLINGAPSLGVLETMGAVRWEGYAAFQRNILHES